MASPSLSAPSPLADSTQLATLVERILTTAKQQGATSAEAAVSFGQGLSVSVRLGEVETVEHHRSRSLGVTVYFGQQKGSASTADWRDQAVQDTVTAACRIARHTGTDPAAGLADPARLATTIPDLDLYHPWELDTDAAIALATRCEDAARVVDPRITNSNGATVSTGQSLSFYGNSHGFAAGYPSSQHSLSCMVVAQDGDKMQRDYWYSAHRVPRMLEAATAVGERAAHRALRRLDSRPLGTRHVPVLYVPELARGLLGHLVSAVRGGSLYRKASFLLDQAGQPVLPDFITLREQPHLPQALGSAPFDSEGVATQERDLIKDGILTGYVLDSYSARRLGLETTGNAGGVHNLSINSGHLDFDGLLQEMDTGLVVTELMGQGINLISGDYSRGAAGFWVENGAIAYPVEEITIAGNLRDMFRGIRAVGNDLDLRGNIRSGSILVDRMTVAGQ